MQEFKRNFDGFQHLFSRFIKESGQGVEWDKISPPPKDKVNFTVSENLIGDTAQCSHPIHVQILPRLWLS